MAYKQFHTHGYVDNRHYAINRVTWKDPKLSTERQVLTDIYQKYLKPLKGQMTSTDDRDLNEYIDFKKTTRTSRLSMSFVNNTITFQSGVSVGTYGLTQWTLTETFDLSDPECFDKLAKLFSQFHA